MSRDATKTSRQAQGEVGRQEEPRVEVAELALEPVERLVRPELRAVGRIEELGVGAQLLLQLAPEALVVSGGHGEESLPPRPAEGKGGAPPGLEW